MITSAADHLVRFVEQPRLLDAFVSELLRRVLRVGAASFSRGFRRFPRIGRGGRGGPGSISASIIRSWGSKERSVKVCV